MLIKIKHCLIKANKVYGQNLIFLILFLIKNQPYFSAFLTSSELFSPVIYNILYTF